MREKIIKYINNNRIAILLLITSLALSMTPLGFVSLFITLSYGVSKLPIFGGNKGLIFKLALGFVIFTASIQILGIVFWLLDIDLTIFSIVLILFLLILTVSRDKGAARARNLFRDDAASLMVALLSMGVIILGSFMHGGSASSNLLRAATAGFDDSQHTLMSLSLVNNHGYAYGDAAYTKEVLLHENRAGYPLGWHLSNAVWWDSTNVDLSSKDHPFRAIIFYLTTKLLWYGLAVYFLTRTIFYLIEAMVRRSLNNRERVIGALFSTFIQVAFLLSIFKFGFGNYLPVFSYLLALLVLSIDFLRKDLNRSSLSQFLVCSFIIAAGLTFTWLLIAPIAYLAIGLIYLQKTDRRPLKHIDLLKNNRLLFATSLLLVLLASIQGYVQIKYSIVPDNLNLDGGIGPLNSTLLLVGLTLLLLLPFTVKPLARLHEYSAAFISSSFLLTGFVFSYQLLTAGSLTYYFTKVGFVSLMLVLVFALSGLTILLASSDIIKSSLMQMFFALAICIGLAFSVNTDLSSVKYALGGERPLSRPVAEYIALMLQENRISDGNLVVYRAENYSEDLLTTQYITMLSRIYDDCHSNIVHSLITNDTRQLLDSALPRCTADYDTTWYVITSSGNYAEVSEALATFEKIEVVLID